MGPLWAWVVLWLVSAYGLVFLLRLVMSRLAVEPVPVLVATPRVADPEPEAPVAEAASSEAVETGLEPAAPTDEPEDPTASLRVPVTEAAVAAMPPDTLDQPGIDPAAPWIKEREEASAADPWIKEREEGGASGPWIEEADGPEPARPSGPEPDEAGSWGEGALDGEEDESVEYRSIDLGSLTLGLAASEIQQVYGLPGHVSKVGPDGEQWRYPLNASDERGEGVHGVLVLEFQRGRLVRKALEDSGAEED